MFLKLILKKVGKILQFYSNLIIFVHPLKKGCPLPTATYSIFSGCDIKHKYYFPLPQGYSESVMDTRDE